MPYWPNRLPTLVCQGADTRTYTALVHALVEGDQHSRALRTVESMLREGEGASPNLITLNLAMRACAALQDGAKALEMYDLMQVGS